MKDRPTATSPSLLESFIACRTTLDDLQQRIAALGRSLPICDIASHLTGKNQFPNATHNTVADAINQRLAELSERRKVSYRR